MREDLGPFEALLLMSFGGPEHPDEVLPFLQNVTRGRGIPDERLQEVGKHYYQFGGRSPINDQNRALLTALQAELSRRGINTPLVWGNRNWAPFLTDAIREENHRTGAERFLAIDTSAYSSYSSCRQYREDFSLASRRLADEGITVSFDKIRQYYNHPGFAEAQLDCVRKALHEYRSLVAPFDPAQHRILYVTHSIPQQMQDNSARMTAGYQAQHEELMHWISEHLAEEFGMIEHELVFCSRSGAPHIPWLEPDINDRMHELADAGVRGVVVVPFGFVSDHMEVKYDLDTEAAQTAHQLGLSFIRAATVGTHPAFVRGLVDLAVERAALARGGTNLAEETVVGRPYGPGSGACSLHCCAGGDPSQTQPIWAEPQAR